jgi:protein-tyrosine-phosphatase
MPERQRVLFICEHGSAKSVIAAAHYARIVKEQGEDAKVMSRGTDPDADYPAHVLAGLAADGLAPLDDSPVRLSTQDTDAATQIISFCSPELIPGNARVTAVWDDVPPVSEGYTAARDEIVRRLAGLFR